MLLLGSSGSLRRFKLPLLDLLLSCPFIRIVFVQIPTKHLSEVVSSPGDALVTVLVLKSRGTEAPGACLREFVKWGDRKISQEKEKETEQY
jgi:hypothetical protein